jgi:hypothetical protein
MSTTMNDLNAAVKAQAAEIVASGADVRPRLAEVVTRNACQSQQSGEGLVGLVKAVMDGARVGVDMEVILHKIQGLGGTVLKTNVEPERAKQIQSTLAAALPAERQPDCS